MAASSTPDRLHPGNGAAAVDGRRETPTRRLSTETKASFKTTEFFAYLAVLVGVLIAAAVSDMVIHGRDGDLQAYLLADTIFHRTLLEAREAATGSMPMS